ncbi:signal peptidase I [Streptomyces sp. CC77]|uniref:signal peptidase I n=1 Tax=Streptomyces sp. CC77 TaxID=1906739 RepID=UPI0009A0CACF|nr:signal peptidase I [Streptomyces sp. CC77]
MTLTASLVALRGYMVADLPSSAMEPAYLPGDRIVAERTEARDLRRGDVVLFSVPDRYRGQLVLQRVVAVGGDRVACCEGGTLTLNGKPLGEPYVKDAAPAAGGVTFDVTVPDGRLFLLGDHRENSRDARFFLDDGHHGTVAETAVQARALAPPTAPLLLGAALPAGTLLALAGGGCVLAGWLLGRRRTTLARGPLLPGGTPT